MICAIIQARMGSSRFPGKMIADLNNRTLVEQVINRVQKSKLINKVVLATSTMESNSVLIEHAHKAGVDTFAGDEDDVLDRFYQCAKKFGATTVVRLTGDCPLLDAEVIDKVISLFQESNADYASNVHPPTFPDGLDVEVFSFNSLERAWNEANLKSEREHVTPFIWKNKELFKQVNLTNDEDLSNLRFTVDEKEDLIVVKNILEKLDSENFSLNDLIRVVKENPEILKLNKGFFRNEGYEKSIQEDLNEGDTMCDQNVNQAINQSNHQFSQSIVWLDKAKKLIPAASQTYSKSYKYFCEGAAPAFIDRGEGGKVWDVDGNEYLDFVCGLGAITLGYNNQEVNQAILDQLKKGISFSQPTVLEVELAQKLVELIPCAEMVKFVKNGSDATTAAVRLARAFTNREVVACSGYHGYHDWYIGTTENDAGVPSSVKELTKTFKYNDIDSIKNVFEENKDQVAAVILEPCQDKGPENNFLKQLKELTQENGAILIFDEVVSGFRNALGGAQEQYGVTPDLSSFGKGIGNGVSVSAVVGRADILKLIDENVFISTTFGGEVTALAAALATIRVLERPESFKHIYELGNMWIDAVEKLINEKNLSDVVRIYGITPHCGVVFTGKGSLSNFDLISVYQQSLIDQGILSIGVNNFCLAHTKEDVNKFISAVDIALNTVKKAVDSDDVDNFLTGEKFRPIFRRN